MATTPTLAGSNSKALQSPKFSSSSSSAAPSGYQAGSVASHDGVGQRRIGGNGSFGAGAFSRPSATSRNSQTKKQHKQSKRFRLDEDALAETMTMRSSTSRKGQTSITHLMNFSSPPRAHFGQYRNPHYRAERRHTTWMNSETDKQRYVNANYRFIVDPRLEYHSQRTNADDHVDWSAILQVLASSESQRDSCPICLDLPAAPRMAKCGHIFCLQCLVRFMASDDDQVKSYEKKARSKKCPLCWESIYMSDTRPVRWYAGNEGSAPVEGGDICLRLMKRQQGNTLALPRDGAESLMSDDDIPWYFAAEVLDYAHVMKGTEDYMRDQLDKDMLALEQQEKDNELMFGDDTLEWTRKAMRILQEAKGKLSGIGNGVKDDLSRKDKSIRPETTPFATNHSLSTIHDIQYRFETSASNVPSEYFFYQGLRHYYLSPLDIRILKEAFGSFASFPATILPRVERVSTGHVVDDDLRKRAKWLGHLPRGCEVCFLECDWRDTVPEDVLSKFCADIERRRRRNEEKDASDEKARILAEREEDNKRYAHIRRRLPDEPQPSWFQEDDFQSLPNHSSDAADPDLPSSTPPWANRSMESPFNSLAEMSTSPSMSRTVWGTPVIATGDASYVPETHAAADDGWLQGWERDLLHEGDDLVAQAQALSLSVESQKISAGKKKKNKKITLMSTNVRRGA